MAEVTSIIAYKEMTHCGKKVNQRAQVMNAVKENPGLTSHELTQCCEVSRHSIASRLAEMFKEGVVEKGDARKCEFSGKYAATWYCAKEVVSWLSSTT